MKIDSYAYIGIWPYWPVKVRRTEDLIGLMDKWGIDKAVVSSTRSIFAVDVDGGNRDVAEAMERWSDRLVGCATVDLGDEGDALRQISWAVDEGMQGLRLYPLYNGYSLRKVKARVVNALIDASLPIAIPYRVIMNWMLPTLSPADIEDFVPKLSGIDVILCAGNYGELAASVEMMKTYGNVHFEISCLQTWEGVERLVELIGEDRVLLGLGIPFQYPACSLAKVEHAEISEEAKSKVLAGNAERIFNL